MSGPDPQLHSITCCGLYTEAASVLLLLRAGSYAELTPGPPAPPDARKGSMGRMQTWGAANMGGLGLAVTMDRQSLHSASMQALLPSWDVCLSHKSPCASGTTPGPWLQEVAGKSPILSTPTPSSLSTTLWPLFLVHLGQALCCLLLSPKCKITAGMCHCTRLATLNSSACHRQLWRAWVPGRT